MCGIFALLNNNNDINNIKTEFMKGKKRGPEFSKLEHLVKCVFGFHRLAINGLNDISNQPIIFHNIILICNGEIYNYKQLYKTIDVSPTTQSDCEIIIHLYIKYGIEQTLLMLDGVFSFILLDIGDERKDNFIFIARDPLGVRPLYMLENKNEVNDSHQLYGFASELKCLEKFYNDDTHNYYIKHFKPGSYSVFKLEYENQNKWRPLIKSMMYFVPTFPYSVLSKNMSVTISNYQSKIFNLVYNAVLKRCMTTEREVACLLSGGLDSSIIASIVSNHFRKKGITIETYSIGLADSEDIKYARIVSDYIGSYHTEIIVTEDEMFNAIPEVIEALESYDTTTVRASLGNYLIGKYIAANSQAKVIFNGDGADELFGGYLYMNKCPDDVEFDKESRRLLKDIHLFDVLRSDKSISSNGLEPRTPFLDRTLVNEVLSIPAYFRNHNNFKNQPEKFLLRGAFNGHFHDKLGRKVLPSKILTRRKEAFSDGVTSQGRSLFVILQEKIRDHFNKVSDDIVTQNTQVKYSIPYEANIETEKKYYKNIFDILYPKCSYIVPYFWMPKYTDTTDPSARTLTHY